MLSEERKPRVLMAVSLPAAERIGRILVEDFRIERAASLRELVHTMRCSSFDLVIVGAHFDGSRAIEALDVVRLHAPQVPLVCVRVAPFCDPLGEATLAAFQTAVEELGVDCFVDLLTFPDDGAGNARIRTMIERLL